MIGNVLPVILFSEKETAMIMKISVSTLRKYRAAGLIEYVKARGKVSFTEQNIRDFCVRNTKGGK